jgi:hypothetical protein
VRPWTVDHRLRELIVTFRYSTSRTGQRRSTSPHAAADGGGTDGGMAARTPRDKDRPVRRAARGIAVNGSDPLVRTSTNIGSYTNNIPYQGVDRYHRSNGPTVIRVLESERAEDF